MKRIIIALIVASVLVAGGFAGYFLSRNTSPNKEDIELVEYKVTNFHYLRWNTTQLWVKFNKPVDDYNIYVYNANKQLVTKEFDYTRDDGFIGINIHKPINFVGQYYVGLGGAWDPNLNDYPFSDLDYVFSIYFEDPKMTITGWSLETEKETSGVFLYTIKITLWLDWANPFYYKYIAWRIGDKTSGGVVGVQRVKVIEPDEPITLRVYVGQIFESGTYRAEITLSGCHYELSDTITISLK